jgi:hypothetical protein
MTTPVKPSASSSPIAQVRLNNVFVPIKSVTLEKTAYSVVDTATLTTFCAGAPMDYGKLAQTVIPCPYEVFIGSGAITPGSSAQGQRALYGLLERTDTIYDEDAIEITARGILALLIDQRMTARLPMNSTVDQVIAGIISSYHLVPQVTPTTVDAGKVLSDDFVSMARNQRAFDVIVALADYLGWKIRVQGTTVIVGPPATRGQVPELALQWGNNAGEKLKITHDALHTRNIKVVVKSYLPRLKSRVSTPAIFQGQSVGTGSVLGLPAQSPLSAQQQRAPSGAQTGFTSVGGNYSGEVYTFHIPGLTIDKCNEMAARIRDDITRHEFVAELVITPDPDQIATLVPAGCEFTVQLSGCSQRSHNGLYHPRKVTWAWAIGQSEGESPGLTCSMLLVNHEVPSPSSGTI